MGRGLREPARPTLVDHTHTHTKVSYLFREAYNPEGCRELYPGSPPDSPGLSSGVLSVALPVREA